VKSPEECQSIEDMRRGIDALDREIIARLGRRARYVVASASHRIIGNLSQ